MYTDPQIPAPEYFSDVRMLRFKLKGDYQGISKLCGNTLNAVVHDVHYAPVGDTIVLSIFWCGRARWNRGSSRVLTEDAAWVQDEPEQSWHVEGEARPWLQPSDRAAWLRLAIGFQVQGTEVDGTTETRFFCPITFAGSPWAVISEREALGYPALLGSFDPATAKSTRQTLRVASYLYESPDRSPDLNPVLRIELPTPLCDLWDRLEPASAPAQPFPFRSGIQVRRYRDAVQVDTASYQDLVKLDYRVTEFATSAPVRPARIHLSTFESLALFRQLGLSADTPVAAGDWYAERCNLEVSVLDDAEPPVPDRFSAFPLRPLARKAAPRMVKRKAAGTSRGESERERVAPAPERRIPALRPGPYQRPSMREADAQVPPPYFFKRMEILGFKFSADRDRLDALCQTLLNFDRRRGFEYRPATGEVILEVLRYPSMQSTAPGYGHFAPDRQYELLLRVLVGKVEEGAAIATDPRVFCPYILVSNPISMISGREILGYPKLYGEFKFDGDPEGLDVALVTVDTQGYAVKDADGGGPSAGSHKRRPLIQINCHRREEDEDFFPVSPEQPWMWHHSDLHDEGLHRDDFVRRWTNRRNRGYGTVQVRQIRDVHHPERYRQLDVVEAQYEISNLEACLPSRPASIQLHDQRNLPIREDLGLPREIFVSAGSWYRSRCDVGLAVRDPLAYDALS